MKFKKEQRRRKIHLRIRKAVVGTSERPRLSVFRSNLAIYCQLIDDRAGTTLLAASTMDKNIGKATKVEQANEVGKLIAKKALDAKIENVVFDRSGYLYHGRIKALAEGARESGLKF
ncbi:MAG: 50S ribosomal protein L18 [Saprospiraceae bacterium]|nr:50S ribosomal protein L18 [Saprospiraceae bacterium]MCF8251750.1 50S ribosomal protein L18 [Saprospiraceae bacterium]MCF8281236.1 50S ribosomal protein L18 [Bacteroidales bacterium]MCF8313392.1 50S ribosomal protein L18 [Saprospiraceae bacterium]MCF8442105.1 50S ribosomal protein L18 [Saprospiraceae bacterium]